MAFDSDNIRQEENIMAKFKRIKDERIIEESNKLTAKMFYLFAGLLILLLGVKLAVGLPLYMWIIEVGTLLVNIVYVVANRASKGILYVKEKDSAIKAVNNAILSKAFIIDMYIVLLGEVIVMFIAVKDNKDYILWLALYIAVWIIPALIITIVSLKNGWILWGGKNRRKSQKKTFTLRVIAGAVIYGALMGSFSIFEKGYFEISDIYYIIGMTVFWGVGFYILMTVMVNIGEKRSEKLADEADSSITRMERKADSAITKMERKADNSTEKMLGNVDGAVEDLLRDDKNNTENVIENAGENHEK